MGVWTARVQKNRVSERVVHECVQAARACLNQMGSVRELGGVLMGVLVGVTCGFICVTWVCL